MGGKKVGGSQRQHEARGKLLVLSVTKINVNVREINETKKHFAQKVMNVFLGCSEALKPNTLPWQLTPPNTRKLMGSSVLVQHSSNHKKDQLSLRRVGRCDRSKGNKDYLAPGCWKRQRNNQPGSNRNALDVSARMIGFLKLLRRTGGGSGPSPAGFRVGSPTLYLMTQICQFIFSGPFVNWNLQSTARCSHKRYYGSITSQSRFGDKCALFPLHSAVEPARPDTLYIALKPHSSFLAAREQTGASASRSKDHRVYSPGEPPEFLCRGLPDCLLHLSGRGRRGPNTLWLTSSD